MSDWSTAVIAGITAAAALGASALQGYVAWKIQARDRRGDEMSLLLQKIEDVFVEIDQVENRVNMVLNNTIERFAMKDDIKNVLPPEPINLGKLRSAVHLYFPECDEAFKRYDKGVDARTKQIHDYGSLDASKALSHLIQHISSIQVLLRDLRKRMTPIAAGAGSSIREAIPRPAKHQVRADINPA